jgi:pantothenate kinase
VNNSNLNFVLLQMTSKSIIVVEDLNRFLTDKSTGISLFVDFHIHFHLYDFLAFKTLANRYMGFKDHKFFSQVDNIL